MSETRELDPRLIDLHLGHLDIAEQVELTRAITESPRLAAQHEALEAVFQALRSVPDEPAPAGLRERVLARVRAVARPPRVVRPRDEVTEAVERSSQRVLWMGNLRDLVAIAALIVLAIGVGVPGMLHMRERGQRVGCSRNLAALGVGLQQYATTFNASLPFAGFSSGATWQPTDEPGLVMVPNRRHVYPLLRAAFITDSRVFVCPSQKHTPMPQGEVARHNDFLDSRNVSYVYQNMAGVRPSANDDARMPILADENPLFANGVPLFRRLSDPADQNSRAHQGSGQNVLTLRGEVQWTTTPRAGIDGDNIWTLKDVTQYTGREGPQTASDAHLLK